MNTAGISNERLAMEHEQFKEFLKSEKSTNTVGMKYDSDKPRYDLEQVKATEEVIKVLTFGAAKYADNNWRIVDKARSRYLAAARRHMAAYSLSEVRDPESGLHHLAHAICCLNFILEIELDLEQKNGV